MSMQYEIRLRYLARLWLDVAPIPNSSPLIEQYLRILPFEGLEQAQAIQREAPAGPYRQALVSKSGAMQIIFPGESFDLAKLPTKDNPELGQLGPFVEDVVKAFTAISMHHKDRSIRRLALIQEGFLAVTPSDFDSIPRRLFSLTQVFREHPPFEWDWKLATKLTQRVGKNDETINTIATIKRRAGSFTEGLKLTEAFDKIQLDLDTNTAPETTPKVLPGDIGAFFKAAQTWHEHLWRDVEGLMEAKG